MAHLKAFQLMPLLASTLLLIPLIISVNGQISTPCTLSMITSYTPCLNFITGSSNNGTTPTTSCCSSLKSLMTTGMDCACLLITASVPLQLPINRTLAISLPRACKMNGVPIGCKSSGTPLPAPGPVLLGPSLPPPTTAPSPFSPRGPVLLGPSLPPPTRAPSPFSPRASKVLAIAPSSRSEINEKLTPVASPPVESRGPTKTSGIRPVLSPPTSSSSTLCIVVLSSLLQLIVAALVFMS